MHHTFNVVGKLTLLFAAMAFTFTGCGYRRPAQVKTTGTVTLDGEPVANVTTAALTPRTKITPPEATAFSAWCPLSKQKVSVAALQTR